MNKKVRNELAEWGLFAGLIAILYFTGLHTPVLGTIQRGLLATGVVRPTISTGGPVTDYTLLLEDLDGNEIHLSEWKSETIFLNFWATWCAPCRAEMPDINDLYNKVGDEVKFALVSVDEDRAKARAFAKDKAYDFPIYFVKSAVPKEFATNSIPTTYVISPEGKIVVTNRGMAQYSHQGFVDFLRGLRQ